MLKTIRGLMFGLLAGLAVSGAAPALAQNPLPTVTPNPGAVAPTAGPASVAAKPADIAHLTPTAGVGMPTDSISLQPQVTNIGHEAAWMHNYILVPAMAVICVLVLILLLWVIVRYRSAANPTPSRTSHNTLIEIIWTLVPVLVLVAIAVPSIKLIAHQYSPPRPDLTIKVIGNQWYWTYQYPDNGDIELVSNMLKERAGSPDALAGRQVATGKERARTDADGPALLAVDERMVVPAGAVVKLITTSNDVIHSFGVPAVWMKMDAIPGKLNETWFKIDRPGVYFGQCSELCGARHAYMPIAIEVVPPAQFAQWVAAKGGHMKGAAPAASPDATSPASPAVAGSSAPDVAAPATGNTIEGVAKPPVSAQAATQN